jgi:hypothetical protein
MSCATSRRSCCCSGKSSLGTNFAATLRMPKSSVKNVFAEPQLIPSSAVSRTVKRRSSMINVHSLSMTSAFRLVDGLPERCSLSADMWPSLKRMNHSLVSAWVSPSLTKLDAVSLFQAFCHLEQNKNATNMCYTTSLSGSDRRIRQCWEAAKNHACTWKTLLPLRCFPTLSPLLTAGKK